MPNDASAAPRRETFHFEHQKLPGNLGDFTANWTVIPLSLVAIAIGIASAFIALILLRLIGFFTNVFFYQRWSTVFVSPAGNRLGGLEVIVPVVGAILVGLIARYGSEMIRGHGIPEAIEAILVNGSEIQPRVAFLKPLASAISIGSGGPFGAEGPIIMTGGAFASVVAQLMDLTSAERKTLLVAGAVAGMSATFASPVAAVLLGVELLLFEWKPRSLIPVALASAAAAVTRRYILGLGPLFPVPAHTIYLNPKSLLGCILIGIAAGALSALLTVSVYAAEDAFRKLPIHWMWWPALGGLVIGIGGLISPRALGVGYDSIDALLRGDLALHVIIVLLIVKWIIWAVSLGSGTSGGILAPLLIMGGALGGMMAPMLPAEAVGFWPLISMGAIMGGTTRSPFTGVIFVLELTHNVTVLLPLLVATVIAHGFTVLTLKRSILTEKVARRGYHLSREYAIDPFEILFVREVMRTNVAVLHAQTPVKDLGQFVRRNSGHGQHLYPVLNDAGRVLGALTRGDLYRLLQEAAAGQKVEKMSDLMRVNLATAFPDEPLEDAVNRMAKNRVTRLMVVDRGDPGKLVGLISLDDLLKARSRNLEAEGRRERVLTVRQFFPARFRSEHDSAHKE